MEQILDQPLIQTNEIGVKYAGFSPRFAAHVLDVIVVAPFSYGIPFVFSLLGIESRMSSISLVLLSVVAVAYKPFMEFVYGATLGKMVLKLKVVNARLKKPSLGEILSRNIFHIAPFLISLALTQVFFQWESSPVFDSSVTILTLVKLAHIFIIIVDIVVLLGDKRYRSLHDRIGGTCVIEHGRDSGSGLVDPG